MYEPRFYRSWSKDKDLVSFSVVVKETDLYVRARSNLKKKALKAVLKYRAPLEKYIEQHPEFLTTLKPFRVEESAPEIVKTMAEAAALVGVGPMASVAGAIAEHVGRDLLPFSSDVIVENGGDIFIKTEVKRTVGVYAGGRSPFTGRIALEIQPEETPMGICASAGTVGHSLSFGKADVCIVLSPSAALADAAATAVGNLVLEASDIQKAIDFGKELEGVSGLVILKDDHMGVWGKVSIVPVEGQPAVR